MMGDYRCPWCGNEMSDPCYDETPMNEAYEVRCPSCQREFEVNWFITKVNFRTVIPFAMREYCRPFHDRACPSWNYVDNCCDYRRHPITDPNRRCPMGYDREVSPDAELYRAFKNISRHACRRIS